MINQPPKTKSAYKGKNLSKCKYSYVPNHDGGVPGVMPDPKIYDTESYKQKKYTKFTLES